ncbi:hypothetical protein [Candidatus Villigracilis affinis]|uniref:hypothetical protein n=1 Tax=Candidatus Villigracilis affinis TaxID=3140682 RepID=UPI002A231D1B|nr:hypothetical protein [Anaerolineales bacterium]
MPEAFAEAEVMAASQRERIEAPCSSCVMKNSARCKKGEFDMLIAVGGDGVLRAGHLCAPSGVWKSSV